MNPFEILSIDSSMDDDEAIRTRYLALVRQYPPERYPDRFAAINRAYELIKNHECRLQYALFPFNSEERTPVEVVINHFRHQSPRQPITADKLKIYLQKCMVDERAAE